VQQNYWNNDKWRFTGVIGAADLRLSLLTPDQDSGAAAVDWRIDGNFLFAKIGRKLKGEWYGGIKARMIDAHQSIGIVGSEPDLDTGNDILSAGLGINLEYDSRDMPINSYSGRHLNLDTLFNDEALGSDATYQSYIATFRSYHRLNDSLVLA